MVETAKPRPRPRPRPQPSLPQHIFIREAARLLNRRMGTLRRWDAEDILPEHLRPHRGHGGSKWRFWTPDQIEGIREWVRDTNRHSGNGLKNYNPTEKDLEKAINKMRRPHPKRISEADQIDI